MDEIENETEKKGPLPPDPKTGVIQMTDFMYRMLESSNLSRDVENKFKHAKVVWAIWGPVDYPEAYKDGDDVPVYARVIRGRDLDPVTATAKGFGVMRVGEEDEAFIAQEEMGDKMEYANNGTCYPDDDHVPAHWMRWLEECIIEEAEDRKHRMRGYPSSS